LTEEGQDQFIYVSDKEYSALLQAFTVLLGYVHQPLHYRRESIRRFREKYDGQFIGVHRLIEAIVANDSRVGVINPQLRLKLHDLETMRAVLNVFMVVAERQDPELMDDFAQLTCGIYISELTHKILAPMMSEDFVSQIVESKVLPLDFLR
jgi:hypothetical protein